MAKLLFAFFDYADCADLSDFNSKLFDIANDNCPQGSIAKVAHLYNAITSLNEAGIRQSETTIENVNSKIADIKKNSFNTFITNRDLTEQREEIALYKSLIALHKKSQKIATKQNGEIDAGVPIY